MGPLRVTTLDEAAEPIVRAVFGSSSVGSFADSGIIVRILFVTAAYLPQSIGGVELHVHALAREARARGHDVLVFSRGADPGRAEFDEERYQVDGVPVLRLNYLFSDCADFEGVYLNPRIRACFERALKDYAPDVVHAHHLTCLSTDLLDAAREAGAGTVLTLHDFWMGCPRGQRMTPDLEPCPDIVLERCASCLPRMWSGWFGAGRDGGEVAAGVSRARDLEQLERYHSWIRGVLARVDRLVTPSQASKDLFVRYGIAPERIDVVENGLDHGAFARPPAPAEARGKGAGPLRIGYIGSVLPTKGVHVLLEAFLALGDIDAELHVHGAATPWHEISDYGARLATRAEAAQGRVRWHGRYEPKDLPALLARIDVLVVPSIWYEAYCLTLREAWLAGVPVIATRTGALPEGVEDGVTGLLVEPGDVADLARALSRVAEDGALRARLASSPKRVRTIQDNADALLALYRPLMRRAG